MFDRDDKPQTRELNHRTIHREHQNHLDDWTILWFFGMNEKPVAKSDEYLGVQVRTVSYDNEFILSPRKDLFFLSRLFSNFNR